MRIDRWTEHWTPWRTLIVLVIGIGVSFGAMFALAGTMSTIASATLVLFGIALTFAVLGFLPITTGETQWAFGPAAVASTFAWMLMVEASSMPALVGVVWPAILVAFFAWEYFHTREHSHGTTPVHHA